MREGSTPGKRLVPGEARWAPISKRSDWILAISSKPIMAPRNELSSFLGTITGFDEIAKIQSDLFEIGAHLASPGTSRFPGVEASRIEDLERAIDAMERELTPLTTFILPGGTASAAQLHIARTVCRRAERRVVALDDDSAETQSTIRYLNRLSDYLFVTARFANLRQGGADVPWTKR